MRTSASSAPASARRSGTDEEPLEDRGRRPPPSSGPASSPRPGCGTGRGPPATAGAMPAPYQSIRGGAPGRPRPGRGPAPPRRLAHRARPPPPPRRPTPSAPVNWGILSRLRGLTGLAQRPLPLVSAQSKSRSRKNQRFRVWVFDIPVYRIHSVSTAVVIPRTMTSRTGSTDAGPRSPGFWSFFADKGPTQGPRSRRLGREFDVDVHREHSRLRVLPHIPHGRPAAARHPAPDAGPGRRRAGPGPFARAVALYRSNEFLLGELEKLTARLPVWGTPTP